MKKRLISLVVLLTLCLGLLPNTAWAAESDFTIDKNGMLTAYNGPGGHVVIPDDVTKINSNAFINNRNNLGGAIRKSPVKSRI